MRFASIICILVAAVVAGSEASAQECPPTPDHSDEITAIMDDLRVAQDATEAQFLTDALWSFWTEAPDEKAQALLDEGMRQRRSFDLLASRDTFDTLVEYCPHYAEGYNQRAFSSFLRQDYAAALYDLDAALDLNPKHIAALSGKALTLMGLQRDDEAQAALREAVALHPWLRERSLLKPEPGVEL